MVAGREGVTEMTCVGVAVALGTSGFCVLHPARAIAVMRIITRGKALLIQESSLAAVQICYGLGNDNLERGS